MHKIQVLVRDSAGASFQSESKYLLFWMLDDKVCACQKRWAVPHGAGMHWQKQESLFKPSAMSTCDVDDNRPQSVILLPMVLWYKDVQPLAGLLAVGDAANDSG